MTNNTPPQLRKTQSSRELWLDVLRVVATLGVIYLHVVGEGYHLPIDDNRWYVALVGDSLVRWSVPVFVMISGVLFLNPVKDVTKAKILRKYIPRLLMAYLFWSLAYTFFTMTIVSVKVGVLVFRTDFLKPQFHLWFLPMLMGVYLLVPLLRRVAEDVGLMHYALVLWAIYLTVSFCLMWEVPQISQLFVMNIVVGYAGYFLLGYYVSQHDTTHRQRHVIYLLGVLGAVITIVGNFAFSYSKGVDDETFLRNTSPFVVMMALALFVGLKHNEEKIGQLIGKFVEMVRRDLFGIYLVHGFWLMVLNREPLRDMTSHLVTLPLITLAVFMGSLYSTKILRRLPGVKKVVE